MVALLNYPEAVTLLNQDLTWTQQLGTSVINQQTAVMDAVQSFRKKVLEAGNLTSDDKRTVTVESQTIVVQPANPQVIYVPSYNPTTVIYAAGPGYPPPDYYSPPYPYYYNPAATFFTGAVFGAAVGFALAWDDHDIYHGDIYHGGVNVNNVNINRNVNVNNVQNRVNNVDRSSVSNKIERNRENVWRPERTSVNRASAGSARATAAVDPEQIRSGLTARSGQPPAANRTQARAGASARAGTQDSRPQRTGAADAAKRSQPVERRQASASGAFSGVDRPAKTEQFSKRGAESLGHGGGAGDVQEVLRVVVEIAPEAVVAMPVAMPAVSTGADRRTDGHDKQMQDTHLCRPFRSLAGWLWVAGTGWTGASRRTLNGR